MESVLRNVFVEIRLRVHLLDFSMSFSICLHSEIRWIQLSLDVAADHVDRQISRRFLKHGRDVDKEVMLRRQSLYLEPCSMLYDRFDGNGESLAAYDSTSHQAQSRRKSVKIDNCHYLGLSTSPAIQNRRKRTSSSNARKGQRPTCKGQCVRQFCSILIMNAFWPPQQRPMQIS